MSFAVPAVTYEQAVEKRHAELCSLSRATVLKTILSVFTLWLVTQVAVPLERTGAALTLADYGLMGFLVLSSIVLFFSAIKSYSELMSTNTIVLTPLSDIKEEQAPTASSLIEFEGSLVQRAKERLQ